MPVPDDPLFLARADACLRKLLSKLDQLDPDELEADLSGGVLRISFSDGRNCVVNRQAAANQIWMAEGATAWHFMFDARSGAWLDTKARGSLEAVLATLVAKKLGRAVDLSD